MEGCRDKLETTISVPSAESDLVGWLGFPLAVVVMETLKGEFTQG